MTPLAKVYAVLCVVGTVLPLVFLGSFVVSEGLDLQAFWDQATESDIARFAWADVVVASVAVIVFALHERSKGLLLWWLPVLATVTVGASLGLPLLLFLRERNEHTFAMMTEA